MPDRIRTSAIGLWIALATNAAIGFEPSGSDSATAPDEATEAAPWWEWERASGDWFGLRSDLEEIGIDFNAEYTFEWSAVWSGGVNRRSSSRNLLTVDATLDLGTIAGLHGGTAFIQYLSVNRERGGSLDSGDLQIYSNIENDRSLDVIYEAWYEQTLLDERLRIKIGKVDTNSEFAFVGVAEDFAHSSAGFSPKIVGFPSYPNPSMSVNIFVTPVRTEGFDWTLGYGLYDGAEAVDGVRTGSRGPSTFFSSSRSDDYFHIIESAFSWSELGSLSSGRVAFGGWYHSGRFERFSGGSRSSTGGVYATIEQRLFDAGVEEESTDGLWIFGQAGATSGSRSEVAGHLSLGLIARGVLPWRAQDSAGIYVSFVDLSNDAGAGFDGNETAIDAYYRFQITPFLSVQPEIQYIINPSGDDSIDNALVGGVRFNIAL